MKSKTLWYIVLVLIIVVVFMLVCNGNRDHYTTIPQAYKPIYCERSIPCDLQEHLASCVMKDGSSGTCNSGKCCNLTAYS